MTTDTLFSLNSNDFEGLDAKSSLFSLSKHEWQLNNFRELELESRLTKTFFIFKPNQERQLCLTTHLARSLDIDGLVTCITLDVVNAGQESVCAALLILAVTDDDREVLLESSQWRPKRVAVGEKWSYGQFCCDSDLANRLIQGALILRLVVKTFADNHDHKEATLLDRERRLAWDVGRYMGDCSLSDVIVECEEMRLQCHKFVLASRSDVFAAMFGQRMSESRDNLVHVNEAEPQAVRDMIEYMYTAKVADLEPQPQHGQHQVSSSDGQNVQRCGHLIQLADRYQMSDLKDYCLSRLLADMSCHNVCHMARLGLFDANLQQRAVEWIAGNPAQVINSEEWRQLQLEMPHIANNVILALSNRMGHH